MSKPAGSCPICNKNFLPDDDVVICPSCGAPYHRACYQQKGHCVFEDRHAAGFEYQPDPATASAGPAPQPPGGQATPPPFYGAGQPGSGGQAGAAVCAACGTVNDGANIFCENCGAPLHRAAPAGGGEPVQAPGAEIAAEIDGISRRDWQDFIGPSAQTYLYRFTLMQRRNSKIGYLLSAFFLGPFYFAYRKMWGWTIPVFLVHTLLSLPNILFLLAAAEAPIMAYIPLNVYNMIQQLQPWLQLVFNLALGVFSLYLYRQHGAKKIRALQQTAQGEANYRAALVRQGGTSVLGVVLVAAALFALSTLFMLLLPQDFAILYSYLMSGQGLAL